MWLIKDHYSHCYRIKPESRGSKYKERIPKQGKNTGERITKVMERKEENKKIKNAEKNLI